MEVIDVATPAGGGKTIPMLCFNAVSFFQLSKEKSAGLVSKWSI